MVPLEGEAALEALCDALRSAGFRVSRSFDLRSAMAAHGSCDCPDHGTDACTCQYAVLLAYALPTGSPVVITAHSSGCHTYVALVEEVGQAPDAEAARKAWAAVSEVVELSTAREAGLSLTHPDSSEEEPQ
jgi:hypothetical protein